MQPILVDIGLPNLPESGFYTDETMITKRGPLWSTQQVAMMFFARRKRWLWDHVTEGHVLLDGVPVVLPRKISSDHPAWRLCDIERVGHALAQGGYLDTMQLLRVLTMIRLIAETWGFLDAEGGALVELRRDVTPLYPRIRAWASERGLRCGAHGPIALPIVAAYLRDQRKPRELES